MAGIRAQVAPGLAGVAWAIYGFANPTILQMGELRDVILALVAQARAFGDVPILVAWD